jgi:hypothetical protein
VLIGGSFAGAIELIMFNNLAKNSSQRSEQGHDATNAAVNPPFADPRGVPAAGARVFPEGRGHDLLQRLRNDPSVRSSERGRALLRLLSTVVVAVSACNEFAEAVPVHCSGTMAELARKNARAWQDIADKFDTS